MRQALRGLKDQLFSFITFVCGGMTVSFLLLMLFLVAARGLQSLSPGFLFGPMKQGGLEGGILYQIAGTAILALTALVWVLPLAFGLALIRSVYLEDRLTRKIFSGLLYILNGIPSILFGVFGYFFFVKWLGWGKSWLAGGILLALMILPTVSLSLSQGMARIPREYLENASALGLTRSAVIWSVYIPQSFSSFLSGALLGLGRACGETAPIMFTATVFSGATLPHGIKDSPVLALPYHIFNLAQESYQRQALENAWGAAFVLIAMAVSLSVCALPFRMGAHEEAKTA